MSKGGARDGAGRKPKWELMGESVKTKLVRIPEVISEGELNEFVRAKLAELEADKLNLSNDDK